MSYTRCFSFSLSLSLQMAGQAKQTDDIVLIEHLLDRYRNTEDPGYLVTQGKLMAADRVWLSQFASGRRFNNAENMRIQQAQAERRKSLIT